MRQSKTTSGERIVKDIKRKTRKRYSAEEKIRIVLDGLRGVPPRRHSAGAVYYKWSKDFLEAGKKRLAGDITRQANSSEVEELKSEARQLKECVAELTLENRLLKKSMIGDGLYCAEYFPSFLLNGAAVMPCKIILKRTVVATTV